MFTPTDIREQLHVADDDALRVLVVGAGVAGGTVAGLLRRAGVHPVLVERSARDADHGYMLALMPMVDAAIEGLGVREAYLDNSVELRRYRFRAHDGRPVRVDSLAGILARFGDYRGISRGALLDVLSAGPVSYGTTVTEVRETGSEVAVTFDAGGQRVDGGFDLVIAADGMHSATRDLVFDSPGVGAVDTGWGGWVVWMDADTDIDLGEELWGADFFVGSYPVKDGIGAFVGGPRSATDGGPAEFVARARAKLATCDGRLDRVLDAVEGSGEPFYWPLRDCRAAGWSKGRVVLLGDAAAGFLPTAGIGAAMAIESAWVLAAMLRDADPADVPTLLRSYERAQRPRVAAAQNTSRRLARLMFRRSKALAVLRDRLMAALSVEAALGPIKKLLANRPNPKGPAGGSGRSCRAANAR